MKIFNLILLFLILSISCRNQNSLDKANAFSENKELYWILKDSTLTIKGLGRLPDFNNYAYVPWYIERSKIKYLTIEEGVSEVGDFNFYSLENLISVSLPQSLTRIGANSFRYCSNLNNITFPKNLTNIGIFAFASCEKLTRLQIPSFVEKIGAQSFIFCKNLDSIITDTNNEFFSSVNGILFTKNKTQLFCYPGGRKDSIIKLDNRLKVIGNNAFLGNNFLKTVYLPDSIEEIGSAAFSECNELMTLFLSKYLKKIGYDAFDNCPSLKQFSISKENEYYETQDGILFNKGKTKIIRYPCNNRNSNFIIPYSVETISSGAFAKCNNLRSITIPKSIKTIEGYAFYMCENISTMKVLWEKPIDDVNDFAFDGLNKNIKLVVPQNSKSKYLESDKWSKLTIE